MKALVKFASGDGNVEVREVPESACGDDQIKLEIGFCGVCGTDVHVLHDTFRNYPPVILGHEFAGQWWRPERMSSKYLRVNGVQFWAPLR